MARSSAGRPPYEPTDKEKNVVMAMASCGLAQDVIAKALQISEPTLRKHFREILTTAMHLFDAKVCATYAQMATSGQHPGVTLFHMKARMGWRTVEQINQRMIDKDGNDVKMQPLDLAAVRAYMQSIPDA